MSAPAAVAASLGVDVVVLVFLYGFLQLRLTAAARTYDDSDKKTVPVNWAAPGWSEIGGRLNVAGMNTSELNARMAFTRGLNLSTVHQARNPPGWLGRMSRWEVPRRRRLMIIGVAVGLTLGVLSDVFPSASHSVSTAVHRAAAGGPLGVLFAAVLAGLMLVAVYAGIVMIRRNLISPRSAIVIPDGWRRHFVRQPAAAAALICHEFSHLRHGDSLQRRIAVTLSDWTSFASVFSAMTAASLEIAGPPGLLVAAFPLGIIAAVGGVLATRRARRLFELAQEVRADAEVLSWGFTAAELRGGLTALHQVAPDSTLARRLRIVTADGTGPFLPGFLAMAALAGLAYALPVVALTAMALA